MTGRLLPSLRTRGDTADEDLAALTAAWGTIYGIGRHDRTWHATCRLEPPVLLTARTPGRLSALIYADWVGRGAR